MPSSCTPPFFQSSSARKLFATVLIPMLGFGLWFYGRIEMVGGWRTGHEVFEKSKTVYTYVGDDYPMFWDISPLDSVYMSLENTVHYAFDTPQGRAEWNTTLPSGRALVHLGPNHRTFTLGVLHHVRCLGILREYLDDLYADKLTDSTSDTRRLQVANHCINNIRQMVLCNSDVRLETVRASKGHGLTVPEVTHVCLDWEAVYNAAESNYENFQQVTRSSNP